MCVRACVRAEQEACWNLLVMLTTANFPDVMIPAFTRRRTVGLIFFPLVVLGVFVLMNVSGDRREACTHAMHGRSRLTIHPLHVGLLPIGQAVIAPKAKHRDVLGESHEG